MKLELKSLCDEMLSKVQVESDKITKQIDIFYLENKDKELTENTFQEQIDDFRHTYENSLAVLINTDTNEFYQIDSECSEKLNTIIENLKNYITDLEEHK